MEQPQSLEQQVSAWERKHLRGRKNANASGGCHVCHMRPAPGTPFAKTACATCTISDSVTQGHGRGASWDEIGGAQEKVLNEVQRALAEAVGDDPDADVAEGFSFEHGAAVYDENPHALTLGSIIGARPDASVILATRFGGARLPELAARIATMFVEPKGADPLPRRGGSYQRRDPAPMSARDAAEFLAVAISEVPALAHLSRRPPDDPDAMEGAAPGIADAFPEVTEGQRAKLAGFLAVWGQLRKSYIRDIQARVQGDTLRDAADGISLQAVWWRIKTIVQRLPAVALLLPNSNGKGIIGRTQRRLLGRQLEISAGVEAEEPDTKGPNDEHPD